MNSFNFNSLFKDPISKCGHILNYWELRLHEFEGVTASAGVTLGAFTLPDVPRGRPDSNQDPTQASQSPGSCHGVWERRLWEVRGTVPRDEVP